MTYTLRQYNNHRFGQRVEIEPKYVVEDKHIRREFNELTAMVDSMIADARESQHVILVNRLQAINDAIADTRKRTLMYSMVVTLN